MMEEENKIPQNNIPEVPKPEGQGVVFVPKRPEEQKSSEHGVIIQTYKSDLDKALDTTEVDVVQQLLKTAREKENFEKELVDTNKKRSWYVTGALLTILVAIFAIAFAYYSYNQLTVPAEKNFSVGIFQKSKPVAVNEVKVEDVFSKINSEENFPDGKPILFNLVSDKKNSVEINKGQFFRFLDAEVTEPFAYQIQVIKLGEVNDGKESTPFVIMSTSDPETASKEFLIEEENLLKIFHKALNINLDSYKEQIGESFESNYYYNLPVRILRSADGVNIVMFYGYATPNTIVVTTKPSVFKTVYDTIIKQI